MLKIMVLLMTATTVCANSSKSKNGLENWALFIVQPKQTAISIYYPTTDALVTRSASQMPKGYYKSKTDIPRIKKCKGINYSTKLMSCAFGNYFNRNGQYRQKSSLVNFETLRYHKSNIEFGTGVFSSDGHYIIRMYGIYNVKTEKITTHYDRSIDINRLVAKDHYGIESSTTPDANGNFYALSVDERGNNPAPEIYHRYNLYDILRKKGKGFNVTINSQKRKIKSWNGFIGNGLYLRNLFNKKTSTYSIAMGKWHPSGGVCLPTHDGKWAWCNYGRFTNKAPFVIYNVKKQKIEKFISPEIPLRGYTVWVWIGDPKKYPGYVAP